MVGVPILSHVLPGLEVVRELVARGHRVTYAVDPAVVPAVAELIAGTGAELVPCTSTLPVADNNWPEDAIAAMGLFLDDAVQALPQLRAVYDDDPADLYLYDIGAYVARALAESQGRPCLQLSPTFVGWRDYHRDVVAHVRKLPGADAFWERFAQWLAGCGATTTDVDTFSGRPPRALALIPRAMQPHAEQVDTDVVTFVGPCSAARADEGGWTRPAGPAGAAKVLLISMGSANTRQAEFYRQCLAAFGDLPGWHVVLQIGKYTDPKELGEIPANVEVHPWVPQPAVLREADAFVTHAGMGGCGDGLLAGVPMLVAPQNMEQSMNADRLVDLGVARRIDTAEATAEDLRTALLDLTADAQVARRSARLRAEVRAEGGAARAADLIEGMLA
ncbi:MULTISPECIES: macrolide family glycosyltransferase [Streptomyces]